MDMCFKKWLEFVGQTDNVNDQSFAQKGLGSQLVGGGKKPEKEFSPERLFKPKGEKHGKSKSNNHISSRSNFIV